MEVEEVRCCIVDDLFEVVAKSCDAAESVTRRFFGICRVT